MKQPEWLREWLEHHIDFKKRDRFYGVYTKWFSAHIDQFAPDICPRWSWTRNRTQGREVRFPLKGPWGFEFSMSGKDYVDLVGGPSYLRNTDWLIDEFDASFNALAIASLRYHMDFAVTHCGDERRRQYTELVERLSEPHPRFTDEEMAVLHPPGWTFDDEWVPADVGKDGKVLSYKFKESTPEQAAVYEAYHIREEEWLSRMRAARHAFIEVMPGLWS